MTLNGVCVCVCVTVCPRSTRIVIHFLTSTMIILINTAGIRAVMRRRQYRDSKNLENDSLSAFNSSATIKRTKAVGYSFLKHYLFVVPLYRP